MGAFDFVEMKIPAKAEYVGVVRLSVSGISSRIGFTYEDIEDLKVAISEAVTNVVTHAYDKQEKGEIRIGFGIYEDKIEMMVADQGDSFQFKDIRDRTGPVGDIDMKQEASELREGGFGLFLINTLMDEVEINNDYGVIISMTKFLNETEVGANGEIPTR